MALLFQWSTSTDLHVSRLKWFSEYNRRWMYKAFMIAWMNCREISFAVLCSNKARQLACTSSIGYYRHGVHDKQKRSTKLIVALISRVAQKVHSSRRRRPKIKCRQTQADTDTDRRTTFNWTEKWRLAVYIYTNANHPLCSGVSSAHYNLVCCFFWVNNLPLRIWYRNYYTDIIIACQTVCMIIQWPCML